MVDTGQHYNHVVLFPGGWQLCQESLSHDHGEGFEETTSLPKRKKLEVQLNEPTNSHELETAMERWLWNAVNKEQ